MKNKKIYNIGLDIGVGSVGWCVTDENSNILKHQGKNMWGSRIFKEADTAKERREYRSSKRRLYRRKERIKFLQSFILDDMEKEYPNFFPMLKETKFDFEDKKISNEILGKKYNLFSDKNITDVTYYENFPTIYHLRNYLIQTKKKVDIRLVYLALHHIIKYRGNFLYEGNFLQSNGEIDEELIKIIEFLKNNYNIILKTNLEEIIKILEDKSISKSNKKDSLIAKFEFYKGDKPVITNIINAILGYTFDLNKIFNLELENNKIKFSSDIENEDEIKETLHENNEIYEALNIIYSWYILQEILRGKQYISEAFIEKYNKYAKDLKTLKDIYIKYFPNEYNDMFRNKRKNNYVAYNGKRIADKCTEEEFFKNLKKIIEKLPNESKEKEEIKHDIEDNNFLKKIHTTENGAIPHQLHEKELEKILENQSQYYKTLKENKENIMKLFSFRIPYYVGPLTKKDNKWSWVVRKDNKSIRPWNFDKIIDIDQTAEKFIKRMTNKCTYLLNKDVIPKESILYSKFCVLNELNNIRINNRKIPKDTKKLIIDKLFKNQKKVTTKMVKELLEHEGFEVKEISGLSDENNFNSSMNSYIKLKEIFGKIDESNIKECENIIYWVTIFEDKDILKRKIKNTYNELTKEQIKKIAKLKFSGWSRLSKELLLDLKAVDGDNIIEKLENTNLNFMQIINDKKFGFKEKLDNLLPKIDRDIKYSDVEAIQTSPANKRAIWQTICVVKEIIKIMGDNPENIYIEFARSEEKDKKIKDNRTKQLIKKYEEIEKEIKYLKNYDNKVYSELKKNQNEKILSEKMYLYYLQNGKCLYSGKPLDIDNLNKYEVDHIIPQSYKKDDSIDNKALVIREENQRKKDSLLLSDSIINRRLEWWKSLLNAGLMSQSKFYKLTRRKMLETDDEAEKFIQRQLVETRQIIKYVTNLLNNQYAETNIFAIRGEQTHNFRSKYKIYKNRNINHYHHAQDAYILCNIGNIINKNWKRKEEFKYSEYIKDYNKEKKNEKHGLIIGYIDKFIDIKKVKKTINYKDYFLSRMLEEGTGKFYNQTLYSPQNTKNKPVIPLKNNLPTNKYGGYSGENKAYLTIYSFINGKNKVEYKLIGIPIQIAYKIKKGEENIEEYIKRTQLKDIEYSNFSIIRNKILINQEYIDENNENMRFCSDKERRPAKELMVNENISELVYIMNLNEEEMVDNNYLEIYDYLLNKLKNEYKIFASTYKKLNNKYEEFEKLSNQDKKSVINGLISLMSTGQGNLKLIGLEEREGRKRKQFTTKELEKMILVDKSVTGMYERRFKINGMENCNSK